MRLPFQVYFLVVFYVLTVKGDGSSTSCPKPYDKMMVCNLMCNLLQDSSASDAIKMLQAKLESLVTVLNKPGKPFGNVLVLSNLQVCTIINNIQCCHEPEKKSARALRLRVCKQRFCSFDTAVARKAIPFFSPFSVVRPPD